MTTPLSPEFYTWDFFTPEDSKEWRYNVDIDEYTERRQYNACTYCRLLRVCLYNKPMRCFDRRQV